MTVHREEKIWAFFVLGLTVVFLAALAYAAWGLGLTTPYTVERIPAQKAAQELKPGVDCVNPNVKQIVNNVVVCQDGRYYVNVLAMRFTWLPNRIVLTDPKEVKFRITSTDVIHGFEIAGTNVNVMVFPGYIAEITWKVPSNMAPGNYLIICNEYCGAGHQNMYAILEIRK
ncbi:cytochrome c oxidase subunit II [Pyrobaculum ferrireducens]|uniref:Cytochrome c oxidase, subunit II n=1 Tax=Pyrobaculum ferrireducens TaxID=1104324 RepID=G7VI95_9CREN|nr:cytochrome c oxidase subunit II [Pyrobaculum ferrireducens]AET32187.1 cytochrome c oxidase, subunit II [Pyrobaculum ferrireducens]